MLGTGLNLFCKSGIELRNAFRECVVCFGSVFITLCSNPVLIFIFNPFFPLKRQFRLLFFFLPALFSKNNTDSELLTL